MEALLTAHGFSVTDEDRLHDLLSDESSKAAFLRDLQLLVTASSPVSPTSPTTYDDAGMSSSSSSSSSSEEEDDDDDGYGKAHPSSLCLKVKTGKTIGKEGDRKKDVLSKLAGNAAAPSATAAGVGGGEEAEWPIRSEWEWEPRTILRRKSLKKLAFSFCPFPPAGVATDSYKDWHEGALIRYLSFCDDDGLSSLLLSSPHSWHVVRLLSFATNSFGHLATVTR